MGGVDAWITGEGLCTYCGQRRCVCERESEDREDEMTHRICFYVYIQSEPGLWTVGFYEPAGNWHAESDHESPEAAANRVHYLNGGERAS